jgi:hypothetical protein
MGEIALAALAKIFVKRHRNPPLGFFGVATNLAILRVQHFKGSGEFSCEAPKGAISLS